MFSYQKITEIILHSYTSKYTTILAVAPVEHQIGTPPRNKRTANLSKQLHMQVFKSHCAVH